MRRRRALTAIAIVLGVVIVGQALGVWKLIPMPMHAIDANEHNLQARWATLELADDQLKIDVSSPGILGEHVQPVSTLDGNRVYLYNDIGGGTVLFGSADADIVRVTVDRDAAVGGKVVDGT